jgi:hypothetical protein
MTIRRRSKRIQPALAPRLGELESRCLLSSSEPVGTWIGQDGHDLTNLTSTLGPDGIQDIHIALSNLPANETIVAAQILPLGGGEWEYNGSFGVAAAALIRSPGSTTADLYLDPYQAETGRGFWIVLDYGDGTSAGFWVTGGTANPNLRMPQVQLQVQWIGQNGTDLTGIGPDVGPDGLQDVKLALSQLTPNAGIQSVTVTGASGISWSYGLNPGGTASNAELVTNPNDPTQAALYFSPNSDLFGQALSVTITYANNTTDTGLVVAAHTNPNLRVPPPAPIALTWNTFTATWIGQNGLNLTGPGDITVALGSLPAGHSVVSATLTDEVGGTWVYESNGAWPDPNAPGAMPLGWRSAAGNPTSAQIGFAPIRNEAGLTLTLTLVLDDGSILATNPAGGTVDLSLRAPKPASTTVTAAPGDNLNALANTYGTVVLSPGTYNLTQPLVLNQPVTITAQPGATLLFSQPSGASPWSAAITINSGNTTLNGFAVRFAGPVVWDENVPYGPAVIGTNDDVSATSAQQQVRVNITLSHLDLMSPPAATSWELAPSLLRLTSAFNGQILDNILKGGTTELLDGPWTIVGNNYEGTVPNTFTYGAFAVHSTHDLVLADNTIEPVGPSGKTWRFLVMTAKGFNDVIQNNTVVGVGPQNSDTVPNPNASEVILTEAYSLHFEGTPAAISSNGLILQIPALQGAIAQAGDVVSVLSGPDAGQWRQIVQALSPTAYLLAAPLPADTGAISISTGFVNETYQGNTIDDRGSSTAAGMVLVGNHFGTIVLNNTFIGGGSAFLIAAAPTESPNVWGWSHAPVLGVVIKGNTLEDTLEGGLIDVQHSVHVKSNTGRVYFSGLLADNTVVWTPDFLAQVAPGGTSPSSLGAITVGDALSIDPGELMLNATGNPIQAPASAQSAAMFDIVSGTVNGQPGTKQTIPLPSVSPPPPVPTPPPPAPSSPPAPAPSPAPSNPPPPTPPPPSSAPPATTSPSQGGSGGSTTTSGTGGISSSPSPAPIIRRPRPAGPLPRPRPPRPPVRVLPVRHIQPPTVFRSIPGRLTGSRPTLSAARQRAGH